MSPNILKVNEFFIFIIYMYICMLGICFLWLDQSWYMLLDVVIE